MKIITQFLKNQIEPISEGSIKVNATEKDIENTLVNFGFVVSKGNIMIESGTFKTVLGIKENAQVIDEVKGTIAVELIIKDIQKEWITTGYYATRQKSTHSWSDKWISTK